MAESTRLVDLVQNRLDDFLDSRTATLQDIDADLTPFLQFSRDFLKGGKRFRALFCYWGWRSVTGDTGDGFPEHSVDLASVVGAASALEIFHAAALVHDDIIDHSDTRRGGAAAHRRFERLHRDKNWIGSSSGFGEAAAILLGDLLLAWSDEVLVDSLLALDSTAAAREARQEFDRMRVEVTAGQYLDVLGELAWPTEPDDDALARAHRVIVFKSAKYSVEAPLVIGAHMAGATAQQVEALRSFGLPLGIAYQLRDDLLGVFGDAARTGKPSGDDLREGKRTVLVALARERVPEETRRLLDEMLGDRALDDGRVRMLQDAIRDTGAVEMVESLIDENLAQALHALSEAPLAPGARSELAGLAEAVTRRNY